MDKTSQKTFSDKGDKVYLSKKIEKFLVYKKSNNRKTKRIFFFFACKKYILLIRNLMKII